MAQDNFPADRWRRTLSLTLSGRVAGSGRPDDTGARPGGRRAAPGAWPPRRLVPLDERLAAMRANGMSHTAIRRALGLSEGQAVVFGVIPPKLPDPGQDRPAAPAEGDGAHGAPGCEDGAHGAPGREDGAHGAPGREGGGAGAFRTASTRDACMDQVLDAVARRGGVGRADLLARRQGRRHVCRRQLAMYLMRELCPGVSLPAIGEFLHRDHTTVLHGCRRAAALLAGDAAFRALCERVRADLGS